LIIGTSSSGSGLPHGVIWVVTCVAFMLFASS
jgi:hypothetical protein